MVCLAAVLLGAAAAAAQVVYTRPALSARFGGRAVMDAASGQAFDTGPNGTVACFVVDTGEPCDRVCRSKTPMDSVTVLAEAGRCSDNQCIRLVATCTIYSFVYACLVRWPMGTGTAHIGPTAKVQGQEVDWNGTVCVGSDEPSSRSETVAYCTATNYGAPALVGIVRDVAPIVSNWPIDVAVGGNALVLAPGVFAEPYLRDGMLVSSGVILGSDLGPMLSPLLSSSSAVSFVRLSNGSGLAVGVRPVEPDPLDDDMAPQGHPVATQVDAVLAASLPWVDGKGLLWRAVLPGWCGLPAAAASWAGKGLATFAMGDGCIWSSAAPPSCVTQVSLQTGAISWSVCGADMPGGTGAYVLAARYVPGPRSGRVSTLLLLRQPVLGGRFAHFVSVTGQSERPSNASVRWQSTRRCATADASAPVRGVVLITLTGCLDQQVDVFVALRVGRAAVPSVTPAPSAAPSPLASSAVSPPPRPPAGPGDGATIAAVAVGASAALGLTAWAGVAWARRWAARAAPSTYQALDGRDPSTLSAQEVAPAEDWLPGR